MADTYRRNEVLAWLKWNFTKFDKSYISETLSSFFHEDELVEANNELANVVTFIADKIEGWLKCVNNRGAPINRRENEECSKQQLHAEDLILIVSSHRQHQSCPAIVCRSRLQPNSAWHVFAGRFEAEITADDVRVLLKMT